MAGRSSPRARALGRARAFTIRLPLLGTSGCEPRARRRHPDGRATALADVSFRRLDDIRVLLVDDEPTANEALQTLLESCGAEVAAAVSAAQALEMLDDWKPDVLISDIAMPEEDGYALIGRCARAAPSAGATSRRRP